MSLPKISIGTNAKPKADAWVIGWYQDESEQKGKAPSVKWQAPKTHLERSKELDGLLASLRESQHFTGKKAEVSVLRYYPWNGAQNVVLLGFGKAGNWTAELARQAGAALFLSQKKERLAKLAVAAESFFAGVSDEQLPYHLQAFCEGYWLVNYEYKDLKKASVEEPVAFSLEWIGLRGSKFEAAIQRASVLARAVHFSRSLGDRPGNVLTPSEFAKLTEQMSKERKIKYSCLGRTALEKEKMGLFVGVAKGSIEEPKLIIMEYSGGKKGEAPIALVGKGITFDSGGISIKPSANMEDMKYDMMGAGAVAGICQAVAELKLPVNIVAVIAACENMPGGKAQKPGDVARSRSGKTVEITNTDAEGRLILADALEFTQDRYKPQAILDFATLTGAVVVALGSVCTGIMGNHPELLRRVKDASEVTSEKVWELPLFEEYEEDLKSNYADIRNSGTREAGSSKGGTFLKFFVDPKTPWVHCDVAGAAYHRKDLSYSPSKYASGVMVRLVAHLLENWKSLK